MKCKKIEKWLSDLIDGELSERKRKEVEDHLQECSLCRAYQEKLERIQTTGKELDSGRVAPDYWEEFPSRIKDRISSFRPKQRERSPFAWGWKWAWVGAALLLVIFMGLYLIQFQPRTEQQVYVFSFEDSLAQVFQEIGGNSELANLFNTIILASIEETLGETEREIVTGLEDLSFPEEELTEEELIQLDSEIKKEIKS
jgi:hypothetical protein